MIMKKKKKKHAPKCYTCNGELEDKFGFAARVGKHKVCITCALKIVSNI